MSARKIHFPTSNFTHSLIGFATSSSSSLRLFIVHVRVLCALGGVTMGLLAGSLNSVSKSVRCHALL